MIIQFIKPYTRQSGRVLSPGALGEFDTETGNQLIADGYAILYATSTSEVGCSNMGDKAHLLMGAHDLVKKYDPESIEENNNFK